MFTLTLIFISHLVVLIVAQRNPLLYKRQEENQPLLGLQCPPYNEDFMGNQLRRFAGVFLGDFRSGGGSVPGPLAVQGNMDSPGINVNTQRGASCPASSDETYFGNYGLVVEGQVDGGPISVTGDAFLAGGGDAAQVHESGRAAGCSIITDQNTGILNFTLWQYQLSQASELFARWYPNMRLNSDNTVTVFRSPDPGHIHYDIFIMDTCDKSITPMYCGDANPEELSDPSHMLLGLGSWSGPTDYDFTTWTPETHEHTVVINVPVNSGHSIRISTARPSQGFLSCNIIYNFYPVDTDGRFDHDGSFTLIRDTEVMGGYVMAYNGHVIDGENGHFSGQVLAKEYSWENPTRGTHIQPYADDPSGHCSDNFEGCFPVLVNIAVPTTTTTEVQPESSTIPTEEPTSAPPEETTSTPDEATSTSSEESTTARVIVTKTETTFAPQIVNTETQYVTYTLTAHEHNIDSTKPITVTKTYTRLHTDHELHTDFHSDWAILPPIVTDITTTKTATHTRTPLTTRTVFAAL